MAGLRLVPECVQVVRVTRKRVCYEREPGGNDGAPQRPVFSTVGVLERLVARERGRAPGQGAATGGRRSRLGLGVSGLGRLVASDQQVRRRPKLGLALS